LASAPALGLAAAKKRGVKLGGLNAKGLAERQALRERAEQLRYLLSWPVSAKGRRGAEQTERCRSSRTTACGF